MRYKLFGNTGLRVSELSLGTMTFGEDWGWGAPREECARLLHAYAEAGGNFIDTANRYTDGSSEEIVGELIAPDRDRWVLSTKYALSTRAGDPNSGGSHRKSLTRALEASLRRLRTDHIDVYWVHIWDVFTPVEEVLRALDDAVRAGKVLYVGISDTPAWLVSRAVTMADLRGWTPFAGIQVAYNLVQRTPERELLPMARELDLAVTTWGPLADGVLSGRYGSDREQPADGRLANVPASVHGALERNLAVADVVNELAAARGESSACVAIAWILAQRGRANIVPIIGARRLEQLEDNLSATELELGDDELERLDEASRIEMGFPHDFVGRSGPYAGLFEQIDSTRPRIWETV